MSRYGKYENELGHQNNLPEEEVIQVSGSTGNGRD